MFGFFSVLSVFFVIGILLALRLGHAPAVWFMLEEGTHDTCDQAVGNCLRSISSSLL
ncbi:hypothetical protein D9M71_746330 [compost metagenome]